MFSIASQLVVTSSWSLENIICLRDSGAREILPTKLDILRLVAG